MKHRNSLIHWDWSLWGLLLLGAAACGHVGIELNGDREANLSSNDAATNEPPPGEHRDAEVTGEGGSSGGEVIDSGTPIDSEIDAGEMDSGSVVDAGGLDPPDADICEVDCPCPTGDICHYDCNSSPCNQTCNEGAVCQISSGTATEVNVACGAEATCKVAGPTTDANDSASFTCEGAGDCSFTCGNASICSVTCAGTGTCSLDCGNALSCVMECADTARCLLNHQNQQTEAIAECTARRICELSPTIACNTDCPAAPTL